MWESFREWIRASGNGSVALVIGGVSTVIGLAQQIGIIAPDFLAPRWVWYLAGAAGLLVGSFVAFHRMRLERDQLRAELEARRPDLRGEIRQTIWGTAPTSGVTAIWLELALRNMGGMPSITQHWRLRITLADGRVLQPRLSHISGEATLGWEGQAEPTKITPANLIYEKTATVPIEVGGSRAGMLHAETVDASRAELERDGVIIRVTCEDVTGRACEIETMQHGPASDKPDTYWPGV